MIKMNGRFFVGSGTINGDDGSFTEQLVFDTHAFLKELGIGGFEGLSGSAGGLMGWVA